MNVNIVPHWKIFPGRLKFFLDGRFHTSKNWFAVPGFLVLLFVPSAFHLGFDAPYLSTHVTVALPIIGFFMGFISFANYFMCAFMDPGFLPRATAEEAYQIEKDNNISVDLSGSYYPTPKNKVISIKGCSYEMKFCTTCKFYRPPRVVHCGVCNMCVERFDHHCPWVSNCVGKRNYKQFYLFLITTAILCIYAVALSATAFGLRVSKLPVGEAFRDSVVSILIGLYSAFVGLNMIAMSGAHTFYLLNEKTTNERLKNRWKTKDNKPINPFSRGNMFRNFIYILCRSIEPKTIKYRHEMDEKYYEKQNQLLQDLRRRNKNANYSSDALIPIPGTQLYDEIKSRNKKQFKEELDLLNTKYLDTETNTKMETLNENDDIIRKIINDQNGYEKCKRYINLRLQSDRGTYWKFLYDNKINNIVILDDRSNEALFNKRYSFLYNKDLASRIGQAENLNIEFGYAYRYTNFSINIFYLSLLNTKDNTDDKEHEVRIYRFWSYDSETNLPTESAYFVKLIQIINFNNPQLIKPQQNRFNRRRRKDLYPKDNFNDLTNYVIHSEEPSRMYSFMVFDHICDEIKLTSRFSTENAFKIFKSIQKPDRLFDNSFKFTLEQYLFGYITALCSLQLTSDIQLNKMKDHIETIFKLGLQTKYPIINDHFETLLENIHGERLVRSNFQPNRSSPENYYKFSIFDTNDFTLIINEEGESTDDLIEYIVSNQIDLLITLNNEESINLCKNLKRTKFNKYSESDLPSSPVLKCLNLKKSINFNLNIDELNDANANALDFSLTHASIDKLDLKKVEKESKVEYTENSVELLSCCLKEIIEDQQIYHERIVLITSDVKIAGILAICLINYRQAQIEKTINVNMSAQTILTRLPKYISAIEKANEGVRTDFSTCFQPIFSLEDYELVYKVSAHTAERVHENNEKKLMERQKMQGSFQERVISL
ncbi:unnamed protein product [Brachionus calyciflorus]|uniref:protein S-acyltransferase n=1 Tax=Brachionus calyciflorus TaxID=104777 RepID=A0A814CEJ8_9BILA|nr:unnamed protein product [Brachionus calyciflorus]